MRQPRSPETSSPAPASCTASTLSRPIAVETPANLIANVPPNPQQASASACSTRSTFGSDEISVVPDVVSRSPRRWWQEQWNATGRRAPTVGAVLASGARKRAELDDALEHAREARIAGEQLGPGVQHRRRARAREHDDRALARGQRGERRRRHAPGVVGEAGVPGRLAAARLALGEGHAVAGPPQHAHGRDARLGAHEVDQAGRHQRDRPALAHRPRSRERPGVRGEVARTPRSRAPPGRRRRGPRRSARRSSWWPGTCAP